MVDVKTNENGFVDFTPQQMAYLELHKLYGIVDTLNEKLTIMDMPFSVIDAMAVAVGQIKSAKQIMFNVINGNSDTNTERHNPINWENIVTSLYYIKNVLMHFSGSIEYLCNNKLMGNKLDLNEKQFELEFENLCVTIKEIGENKFDIVDCIEIYDDAGFFVNTFSMEEINKNYREYRKL